MLSLSVRQTVKGDLEGLFEQRGQPLGKCLALGDDAELAGREGIAVSQHAVGLRLGAALAAQRGTAQFLFHIS